MDCKAASNLVSDWLDGKLDCGEAAFLQHLNGCRACSLEMNELQAVLAALRENSVAVPAPEGFAQRACC
jgi:predicted anti-sigma-YlaC factor YlaD